MAHSLILGMTKSGKSTLAKKLIREWMAAGKRSLVLDPRIEEEWQKVEWSREGAAFVTGDKELFLQVCFRSRSCALFVDEGGEAIGRYSGEMKKIATRSRHYGHDAHFIAQRAADLDKTIRDQCDFLCAFRQSRSDAETLANEYGYEELLGCASLDQGEYWQCGRFSKPKKIRLFWPK